MNTRQQQQGFTIIEVVLVLAIAALIFLMIFVALPALQSGQRDTARKNDASIVSSAVTKFTSAYRRPLNNTTDQTNLRAYVTKLDQYTTNGAAVYIRGQGNTDGTVIPTVDQIWVNYNAKCDGPNAIAGTNARQATVRLRLEDNTAYCVDAS